MLPEPAPRRALPVEVRPALDAQFAEARLLSQQLAEEAHVDAPLAELFPAGFLETHANVPDLETLFAKAGLRPTGPVDRDLLHALGSGTLDRVVAENTDFETWAELEHAAERSYVARRLLEFTL